MKAEANTENRRPKKWNPRPKTERDENVYVSGRLYSRCFSLSQCISPHPSSSKSVSEKWTESQLSAQRQAASHHPSFCCSQSFKCYYETAVMKISLISINCCGEKQANREISAMPAAARAAHQWAVKHCGASVIKISGSVKMHTRVKQNTKRCSQHFTVYIRRSQLASINLLAKSPVLIL